MAFDIDTWVNTVTQKLQEKFNKRLLFAGLQGSYARGEAADTSDIDLVVILDVLNFEDLKTYRSIIDGMDDKDKACGFISGKDELQKWSKADMFQFFYETKSLIGNLQDIIIQPSTEDIKQAVKIGSENLYHAAVHSFVHAGNLAQDLQNMYKMTFFILQAKYFIEYQNYVKTKKELYQCLTGIDKEILYICINKDGIIYSENVNLESLCEKLIKWTCQNI